MALKEGAKAPAFTLQDADGKRVSLRDFAGRSVILYFYPKDDTPGCTKEACGFRDLWPQIQAHGAVVLGVSPDAPQAHRAFIDKHELPFQLLCDPDKSTMTKYGAFGEKTSYGKKTIGVIRSTVLIGGDGTVRKHWASVRDAGTHPTQVLAALVAETVQG